ncbi:hypothetical protein Bbelb_015320 [Branchiostoma belcheri]|nr:hypothetical protein Bbelb_015320 [Branchiostoma belcheri]
MLEGSGARRDDGVTLGEQIPATKIPGISVLCQSREEWGSLFAVLKGVNIPYFSAQFGTLLPEEENKWNCPGGSRQKVPFTFPGQLGLSLPGPFEMLVEVIMMLLTRRKQAGQLCWKGRAVSFQSAWDSAESTPRTSSPACLSGSGSQTECGVTKATPDHGITSPSPFPHTRVSCGPANLHWAASFHSL